MINEKIIPINCDDFVCHSRFNGIYSCSTNHLWLCGITFSM